MYISDLTVTIIGDASNQALGLASRLFIGTNSSISTYVTTVGGAKNIQSCVSLPAYIKVSEDIITYGSECLI